MLLEAACTDEASLAIKQAKQQRIRHSIWESAKSRDQKYSVPKTRITEINHMVCSK